MLDAPGQDRSERESLSITSREPRAIVITDHFAAPRRSATIELAIQSVEEMIDQKRAADAARAPVDLLWKHSFLKFIPIPEGGHPEAMMSPVVKNDDPFFAPAYLTVRGRQIDHQMALSEKQALTLFSA